MKQSLDSLGLTPAAVIAATAAVGVTLTTAQAGLIISHAEYVVEANQRINLTRLTTPSDVLALHIVDSLAFLPFVHDPLTGKMIDIGSGAGYPGIPLAILGYTVTLCESVKKKAVFLENAVRNLGLSTSVAPLRAEELASRDPESADCVVARAVSSLASLVELAAPLLRPGGRLIALKGLPTADERSVAGGAARLCAMEITTDFAYELPGGERRTLLIYNKVGKPRVSLPRRPGSAQRQPLG